MTSLCWDIVCAASPYVAPARPRFPPSLVRRVHAECHGCCFHCGVALPADDTGRRRWDVDHHPVPFREIADQLCCGVRDTLDESNLVASCIACNRGGTHERAQACRCHRRYVVRAARAACTVSTLIIVVLLIMVVVRRVASGGVFTIWSPFMENATHPYNHHDLHDSNVDRRTRIRQHGSP